MRKPETEQLLSITNRTGIPQTIYPPGVRLEPDVTTVMSLQHVRPLMGKEGFQIDCPPNARYAYVGPNGLQLLWASPFSADEGYSCAAEHTMHALVSAGVKVSVLNLWFYNPQGILPSTKEMVERENGLDKLHWVGICLAPPGFYRTIPTRVRIGITMFETTDPLNWHPDWPQLINNHLSVLVVPTAWQVPVFEQFVSIPVEVAPLAIPLYRFRDWSGNHETFTVGTWGTLTDRKGAADMVRAFRLAFPPNEYPHCRLMLKTKHSILGNRSQVLGIGTAMGEIPDGRVIVCNEVWSPAQMENFIGSLDCALFLSRGEGFGMPAREAMAAGVPTVLAANTGHIEVVDPAYNWPVPTLRTEASPMGGEWWIPDVDAAVAALREIYERRAEAREKAMLGARWFREKWGPEAVASRLIEIVEKYGGGL